MSDSWFNEYTYQVVIQRKHLTPELLAAHEQAPAILKPWDPMGSLALMKGQIENET
jgi:bleomycin hydrolase